MSRLTAARRWFIVGLTFLILVLVVVASSRWGETPQVPVLGPHAETIVPGIHLLGGLVPAAAYAVETSDGLVLIDTGLRADKLRCELRSLGLDWKRVRAIFLTHVHADHCGGAQELRELTGAKVYAGEGDAAVLRAGKPREAFCSTFYMPEATLDPTTVDVALSDGQVLAIGDARFTALSTPGHTPGSVCYLMERGDRRVLFSGDVIMSLVGKEGSRARLARPLGTYAAYLAPRYRGNAAAFLSTLKRLRAMPAPQLVLPGHPRNDPVPQSPLMTPSRWAALLEPGIREMEKLVQRYARDGGNFLDGSPKQLLPDLYYLGDFTGVAVYGFVASSKFFLVNAPGGRGLSDFVWAALRELGREPVIPTAVLLTSGDAACASGLTDLLEKWHPRIVVPPAGWKKIEKTCPNGTSVLAPEELPQQGWFPVTPIALRGRGLAPTAYLLPWANKSVLITGPIPIKVTGTTREGSSAEFARGQGNLVEYRDSLYRLGDWAPDLWLPASPVEGQNANLYDGEWREVLTTNERLFR